MTATVAASTAAGVVGANTPATPNFALPAGCNFYFPTQTTAIAICKAEKEELFDKLLPSIPSVLLSLVAVALAFASFRYSKGKDANARTQSIQDDYWLRKIVSPVSIEPFVLLCNEIVAKLPDASQQASAVDAFYTAYHAKVLDLRPGFLTLKLLDGTTATNAILALEAFEDALAVYCHALKHHLAVNGSLPDRPAAINELINSRLGLLRTIQKHQKSLRSD